MLRYLFNTVLLLFSVQYAAIAQAERFGDFYNSTIPVESQTRLDIENASRHALGSVLLRLTGLAKLPDSTEIRQSLENSQSFVLQSLVSSTEIDSEGVRKTLLTIYFDPPLIQQLIRSLNLPLWPANRPSVLMLAAVEDGNQRFVLADLGNDKVTRRVKSRADERGLPLMLPLMDVVDLRRVSVTSIEGGFLQELRIAAQRYPTQATAIVLVKPHVFGKYRTQTLLWNNDEEYSWVHDSDDITSAAVDMVDKIVDLFVSKYAVPSASSTDISLTIMGVHTLESYRHVYDYLAQWEFIESIFIEKVEGDSFTVRLTTSSSLEQLTAHFLTDGRIQLREELPQSNVFEWLTSQ